MTLTEVRENSTTGIRGNIKEISQENKIKQKYKDKYIKKR